MKEYDKVEINGDIPKTLKLVLVFIDRVGFPVLAFCLMFWMSYSSLDKVSCAISSNTSALLEFKTSTREFQQSVIEAHKDFSTQISRVNERLYKGQ